MSSNTYLELRSFFGNKGTFNGCFFISRVSDSGDIESRLIGKTNDADLEEILQKVDAIAKDLANSGLISSNNPAPLLSIERYAGQAAFFTAFILAGLKVFRVPLSPRVKAHVNDIKRYVEMIESYEHK